LRCFSIAIEIKLIGREKIHYETLETLYNFSECEKVDLSKLKNDLDQTIDDWDKLTGGGSGLVEYTQKLSSDVQKGNKQNAKILYLLLSPIFYYIHALSEVSRNHWRNVVTSCGIFCERIVRNLLQEYDGRYNTTNYNEVKDAKFENKNGRLKGELESKQFSLADRLFNYLKIIYHSRNQQGPHDVPPPESIQAKIIITQCLPSYIDYLNTLVFLGIPLNEVYDNFVAFFDSLTETKISMVFGTDTEQLTVTEVLRDRLYKEGFFSTGRTLKEVSTELSNRRFNFSPQSISKALLNLSKGKRAIFTRRGKRGNYRYIERLSPSLYFKKTI